MSGASVLIGFLILFLLYQLAEANAQGLLKIPGKPYSIFLLFLLVLPAADLVARWQGAPGLSAYGLGFHPGWQQNYLFGVGLGVAVQAVLEWVGVRIGIRQVANLRFSLRTVIVGLLWILFANFPAAAAEDLITRGYPWRFLYTIPLGAFIAFSAALYTFNHIIRLMTRPITDWYHLPFLGLTLAYALFQTGSLWYVIGLHQSGNVIFYLMRQLMDVTTTTDVKKRIGFGVLSELIFFGVVILATPLVKCAFP
jgi:uncharacterized protein